jgi:microcystin degradation protein MlrC
MIREIVGPSVPIVGTFDLHGNISDHCVAQYDFMCPVHLYPHTDTFERGAKNALNPFDVLTLHFIRPKPVLVNHLFSS